MGLFRQVGRSADNVVFRSCMRVIKAVWSGFNSISTRSPTDTGLVLRIPFNLKLPLILQRIESPFSVRTIYQLPVFFVTRPSMQ